MYYKILLLKFAIFALGAGVGFLSAKKIYEEYYAQLAQEEIDSVKEAFENRRELTVVTSENGMTDDEYEKKEVTGEECSASIKERTNNNVSLVRSFLDGNINEQAKKNYNLVSMKKDEATIDEDEEVTGGPVTDAAGKTEEEMDLTQVDRTLPYIIDDREFTEEFDHHDKISLYYYTVDEVLCDEHEEVINDIEEIVGYDEDVFAALDMHTAVWVRNEPLCIDYEIISINKSFAEAVHGVGIAEKNLSPRERYLRNQKRRENREE